MLVVGTGCRRSAIRNSGPKPVRKVASLELRTHHNHFLQFFFLLPAEHTGIYHIVYIYVGKQGSRKL